MLHILSYSPWKFDINHILRTLKVSNDDLLLIQDGVFGAIEGGCFIKAIIKIPISLFVLKEDADARGISNYISTYIKLIKYPDFVNLTIKHTSQIRW